MNTQPTTDPADPRARTPVDIGIDRGRVVMQFHAPTAVVDLAPGHAMEVAVSLMRHARRAGAKEPAVFRKGD